MYLFVNFCSGLYEERLIFRPVNVFVYGCLGEKHNWVDLTGVYVPLIRLMIKSITINLRSLSQIAPIEFMTHYFFETTKYYFYVYKNI